MISLAALTVVAFAGGAYAATQSSGPSTRQAFLDDVAKRLHVTSAQLSAALTGAYGDQLQAEVKAGRITQAQANALEQRLKRNGTAPLPFGPPPATPGAPRPVGPLGGFGPRALGPMGGGLQAAASYLGMTNAQLLSQLSAGKSLAQIATSKGKTAAGLEAAMTAAVKTRLDKLVANKVLTAKQEQQLLQRFSARLSQEINSTHLGFHAAGPDGFLFRAPRPYGPSRQSPPANAPLPPAGLPSTPGTPPPAPAA